MHYKDSKTGSTAKTGMFNTAAAPAPNTPSTEFKRDPVLIKTLNESFAKALEIDKKKTTTNDPCPYFGNYDDYLFDLNGCTVTVEGILKNKNNKKLNICDVGAGNFTLNNICQKFPNTTYHGITLDKPTTKVKHPPHLIVGKNAEFLSEHFPQNHFDLIVSKKTYMHFSDPIGSIIEAYKTLKDGGVLIIDHFSIPGCEKHLDAILNSLRLAGYRIIGYAEEGKIKNFIIQKTKPELKFGLQLNKIIESVTDRPRAMYSLNPDLQKTAEFDTNAFIYAQGREVIQTQILESKNEKMIHIFRSSTSLTELFSNPDYANLASHEKHLLIQGVVGTHNETLARLQDKTNALLSAYPNDQRFFNEYLNKFDIDILFYISFNEEFKRFPIFLQTNLIEWFAAKMIIADLNTNMFKKTFKEMDIHFETTKAGDNYRGILTSRPESEYLLFPEIASNEGTLSHYNDILEVYNPNKNENDFDMNEDFFDDDNKDDKSNILKK